MKIPLPTFTIPVLETDTPKQAAEKLRLARVCNAWVRADERATRRAMKRAAKAMWDTPLPRINLEDFLEPKP